MSPGSTQSIRHTTNQLKSLEDIDSYSFETLDDTSRSKIESKFKEHRIIEVQKSFERLVMAKTNQDRQIAFESLVYLLQLANEENNSFAEGDIEPENIEEKV
jgi:hypothetical protein